MSWHQKVGHNVKNDVITSKITYVMPWKIYKVCNDVKKYVMMSKSTSWREKVRNNVKGMPSCQKVWKVRFDYIKKRCHDVKNYFMPSKMYAGMLFSIFNNLLFSPIFWKIPIFQEISGIHVIICNWLQKNCIHEWGGKGYSRATFLPLSYFPFTVLIAN